MQWQRALIRLVPICILLSGILMSVLRGFLYDFVFFNEKSFYFPASLEGNSVLIYVSLMKKLIILQSNNALTALQFFDFPKILDGSFLRASLGKLGNLQKILFYFSKRYCIDSTFIFHKILLIFSRHLRVLLKK